jgi:hypothetical protein
VHHFIPHIPPGQPPPGGGIPQAPLSQPPPDEITEENDEISFTYFFDLHFGQITSSGFSFVL